MKVLVLLQIVANGVVKAEDVAHPFNLSVTKCKVVELNGFEKTKIEVFVKELNKVKN